MLSFPSCVQRRLGGKLDRDAVAAGSVPVVDLNPNSRLTGCGVGVDMKGRSSVPTGPTDMETRLRSLEAEVSRRGDEFDVLRVVAS
jgi:hypothetical protein